MSDHETTQVLKRASPMWWWLRKNFSPASLATLAVGLGSIGGWALSLKTRVIILENKVKVIESTADKATLADHEHRITKLETEWQDASEAASLPPMGRRKK